MRTSAIAAAVIFTCPAFGQELHPAAIPADLRVDFAPQAVTAEGQRHIVYELHVTNYGRADLTLRRLDVLDGASGAVLTSYEGDALLAIISRPGTPGLPDRRVIGAGLQAVAFIDVISASTSAAPKSIRNRVTFDALVPPNGPLQSVVVGPVVTIDQTRPVVLGPPVEGGGWLASHGLSNLSSHRRTLLAIDGSARIAQRFAVDWTRIGADGQVFRGDPSKNENWTPYGSPVLAVADGRVVDIQDGVPENDPTADTKAVQITLETVGGNYLILDLGGNRYAFYAHLKPGSFLVARGERVKRGQRIARLGNSGQSDAPHLHLHITDAPSPLAAEGLPMVFESFELLGHVPSLAVLTNGTGWTPRGAPSLRRYEMPVENAVVGFRSAPTRQSEATGTLLVKVRTQGRPLSGAIVNVARDSSLIGVVRSALTDSLGVARIDSVPLGGAFVRVRGIGYEPERRNVRVLRRVQSLSVEMKLGVMGEIRRHIRRDFERRLALARSRPRHWSCGVSPDVVREQALEALHLRESMQPYLGIGADSASFIQSFRTVESSDCARIAEAVDRSYGLIDDNLLVFRIGKAFWFPRVGYGILTDHTGKILISYIVPD